jgi:Holliday junction resolvasome RuvABC endonuclease subunit
VTRLALAIDYSSTALHCTYGPGPVPLRAVLRLRGQQPEERIASACDQLVTLLDRLERRWAPSMGLLVMERPFVGKNARSGIALAQVQAACLTTAYLWRWTVLQEDPSRIRANVIGLGVAPKGEKIKDRLSRHRRLRSLPPREQLPPAAPPADPPGRGADPVRPGRDRGRRADAGLPGLRGAGRRRRPALGRRRADRSRRARTSRVGCRDLPLGAALR